MVTSETRSECCAPGKLADDPDVWLEAQTKWVATHWQPGGTSAQSRR